MVEAIKNEEDIITLAIETSCDETSVSVLKNGRTILSNVIHSQIEQHKKFGGVVPEVASRQHIELINDVIEKALKESGKSFNDITHVGVTYGPGLVGALLVGLSAGKAIALARDIPLNGVNHIEGHIYANFLEHPNLEPPFIALIVSGGHSHLVHMKDYGEYEILGRTRDDAAGEAFDKVARALGLGYPGGPLIDKLAKEGNNEKIKFPRAYLEGNSFDFSFSGLKSSVLNYINTQKMKNEPIIVEDVAASFQQAVIDVLVEKTVHLALEKSVSQVVLAGGVAANSGLRNSLINRCEKHEIDVKFPSLILCTDNAAMIGCVAYYEYIRGKRHGYDLNAVPNLKL